MFGTFSIFSPPARWELLDFKIALRPFLRRLLLLLLASSSPPQLLIAVGTAGPQLPAPDPTGHRWTPEPSGHWWTSTGDLPSPVGTAGPQPPDRMPEYMPSRMPDRMPDETMPDRMSDRMPEYMSKSTLAEGVVSAKMLQRLRGRLLWFENFVCGRQANFLVAHLGSFMHGGGTNQTIDSELKATLTRLLERVEKGGPVTVSAKFFPHGFVSRTELVRAERQ